MPGPDPSAAQALNHAPATGRTALAALRQPVRCREHRWLVVEAGAGAAAGHAVPGQLWWPPGPMPCRRERRWSGSRWSSFRAAPRRGRRLPDPPALRSRPSLLAPPARAADTSALPSPVTDGTETVTDLPPPTARRPAFASSTTPRRGAADRMAGHSAAWQAKAAGPRRGLREGIHVRGRPSPQQRVQFVLGLVGLGQPGSLPDACAAKITRCHRRRAARAGRMANWMTG